MEGYAYNVAVVFCYLIKEGKVLLIKREKSPSYRQYTVVGGKKEPGEDLFAACRREVFEETGLTVEDLRLRGVASQFLEGRGFEVTSYYFLSDDFSGEVFASAEGALEWCDIGQSLQKDGISEYYVRVTPYVMDAGRVFLASIRSDREGRIVSFEAHM